MPKPSSDRVELVSYYPGVIGDVTRLHATYYHQHWGFDISFEIEVAGDLAEFFSSFQEGRDLFRAALNQGEFAGSIAIDGSRAHAEGARLRWFIVDEALQGHGIGRRLIHDALDFCSRAGFSTVFLWTFEGLAAARRLYEETGFRLAEEHRIDQWGGEITEQKFELVL